MNFDFSDAQKALKQQTRNFLRAACDTTVPRRVLEDADEPFARDLGGKSAPMSPPGSRSPRSTAASASATSNSASSPRN